MKKQTRLFLGRGGRSRSLCVGKGCDPLRFRQHAGHARIWITFLVILSFIAPSIPASAAIGQESSTLDCGQTNECIFVRGTIELTAFPMTQNVATNRVFVRDYEIISSGPLWRMRITDPTIDTNAYLLFWELGNDGESVYEIAVFNTNFVGEMEYHRPQKGTNASIKRFAGSFRATNTAIGAILEGDVPSSLAGYHLAQLIWLANASGCYLASSKDNTLPPIHTGLPAFAIAKMSVPATWECARDYPQLPLRLEMHPDFNLVLIAGEPRKMRLPQKYTNFAYQVETITNIGRWVLPKRYSAQAFKLLPSSKLDSPSVQKKEYEVSGVTHEVRMIPYQSDFLPQVRPKTIVSDYRPRYGEKFEVTDAGNYPYFISGKWPTVSEAHSMREPPRTAEPSSGTKTSAKARVNGIFVLMVLSVPFLILVTWPWLQRQITNNQKSEKK